MAKKTSGRRKILIVDDHPVLRQGIAQLIALENDMTVCGEAADAGEALKVAQETQPDVAIVDISLHDSNGIDLIKDMLIRWPKLPILVLSMHSESFYAERVFRAGAKGYVTKGEPSGKVIEGLRKVLAGEVYVSEKLASKMIGRLMGGGRADASGFSIDRLSDREFQVFELIGQGMQTREIAQKLHLSIKTIDAHRENIKNKLKLDNATELLKTAIHWVQFERGD
ncbi:MAG: Oxygen regulatory protein NreC [Planctomycetes bacterium ADurb.Bin126]|nr:MAG: Oxygen regulatory protein NreC [Planctomycetes bacterium ADurb.Bin126]HOD84407.1 response regulator transcription factor [Phycisphaerae bacterium]HQL75618.1 response regulator transcription factor [Phycisphaerae bacterium]